MPFHIYAYAARLEQADEGDYVLTFRDIPEALTGENDPDSAWALASDALAAAAELYLARDCALPEPSAAQAGERLIPLEPQLAARGLLRRSMKEQGLSGRELGKRLGKDERHVRRILDGHGASMRATLDALAALGLRPALAL